MAYIYKILNKKNNKIYIGKTEFSIEKRWKEHLRDSKKNLDRPLYRAMNKYGIENFDIEQVEKTDSPVEREQYWIEYYGSFKYGYNATKGGDGRSYLDYDLVISTYKELKNATETAKKLGIYEESVRNILKARNEYIYSSSEVNQMKLSHIIKQYNLQGKYIQSFPSARAAAESIKGKNCSHGVISHITDVCKGIRKTAYGFIWKFEKE